MEIKPAYQKVYEKAKPFLRTRKNLIHTRISLGYALKLLKREKGDEEVVIPAILLHDVGWKVVPENLHLTAFGPNPSNPQLTRLHQVEGAKIARTILKELRYPCEKAEEICRIIRGHDSRKRAISRSDRIVKDSDKLFRYSRKGILLELDWFPVSKKALLHFLGEQIEKWFFLPTSRQMAEDELARRRKEMKRI